MSRATKHAYEITEIHGDFPNAEIGGHLVDSNHVRKYHEPYRTWYFLSLSAKVNSGDGFRSIVGEHIGEYEKVKHLLMANTGGGVS